MPPRLEVVIDGNASGLTTALGSAGGAVGKFGMALNLLKTHPVLLAISAVTTLGLALADATVAGSNAIAEEREFARAMRLVTTDSDKRTAATEAAITASQQLAFTDTETMKAITTLATATGSTESAITLLATAQDLARVSGTSLEAAADAVAKAHVGQDLALKRLIPGMKAGATSADTIAEATRLAAGAADEYANSADAIAFKTKDSFAELSEEVGKNLVPIMQDLLETLVPIITEGVKLAVKVLPPIVAVLKTFFVVGKSVFGVLSDIATAIGDLIAAIGEALKPLRDFIDLLGSIDLNPLNHLPDILPFAASSAAQGKSATQQSTTQQNSGGVQINIYGDPAVIEAKVTKALRDYARRNGVSSVFALNGQR